MKNNLVVILLVVLIGTLTGLGLLIGIGNAVQVATFPLVDRMERIASIEKDLVHKVDALTAQVTALDSKLSAVQMRVASNPMVGGQQVPPQFAQQQQPPAEDLNKVYDIPVGQTPIVGKKDAKVTIVEFTDLQCPFCARFYPIAKQAHEAFPNDVRIMLKNYPLPFHPNAMPAAKLSLAANEQGKYIEMVESLLDNGGDVSEAKVKEYAKKIGLNYDKLMADAKNNEARYSQQIKDEMELANKVDVRGTPTFFINGKKTQARDPESFKAAVKAVLDQK